MNLQKVFGLACKSIQGRALYFETYLPEHAALYMISSLSVLLLVSLPDVKENLALEELELWDAFSDHGFTVIEKASSTLDARAKVLSSIKEMVFKENIYLL